MRKLLFLMTIGTCVLAGCSTSKRTASVPPDEEGRSGAVVTYELFEKNAKTKPFTAKDAEREIMALLDDGNLTTWRGTWALGGEFKNIEDFFSKQDTVTTNGTLMWFTFDGKDMSTNRDRSLILGCEYWHRAEKRRKPRASILRAPDQIFTFNGSRSDFKLQDHEALSNRPIGNSLRNDEAKRRVKSYNKLVRRRLHVSGRTDYNRDCGAFFQNNVEEGNHDSRGLLTRFVNQEDAVGMRYYFALEPAQRRNRIRIFLVATDSAGNNLLDAASTRSGEAPLILQKSIPPGGDDDSR